MSQTPQGQSQPKAPDFNAHATEHYKYHVYMAARYEQSINRMKDRLEASYRRTNPAASTEWIEQQISEDHYFKAAVSKQQFHVRQATMYGLGMLSENIISLTVSLHSRPFNG